MATRKPKKEKQADSDAFVVGEDGAPSGDERPSVSEETVDGLLALRGHLEQRVPGGLLWPLQQLPSMAQHLSDVESAGEAVDRIAVRHAMSSAKIDELRRFLLNDAYAFAYLACRHRDIVPEVHMAMCYASSGQAGKLAWLITQSGFEGYVIEQFRNACCARSIDPSTISGVYALDKALDWQDQRWPRGWYKSSAITHASVTLKATIDPNRAILIVCAKEDKAFQLVEQTGKTLQSGIYADLFPDRVPKAARDITKSEIAVAGRNVSSREKTVQGTSYITREIGGHYSDIHTDDIVIRDVRGGLVGGGVDGPAIRWLHGMQSMRIKSQRFRLVHAGTVNSLEDDDHAWLTYGRRASLVMSVVVPAETYPDGVYPTSVYQRGTPTAPTFFDESHINEALDKMVADDAEASGVEAFRADYWLAPSKNRSRIFTEDLVNDAERTWSGPYQHPDAKVRKLYPNRFVVARVARDENGSPVNSHKRVVDDMVRAAIVSADPWADLDIIITLNTTWASGAKSWGLSVTAVDSELTRFLLEARTGDGGADEWATALRDVTKFYEPRTIGMDRKGHSDAVVQNMLSTDARLRFLRNRIVPVDQADATEEARIRAGVAEPLAAWRLLLMPTNQENDFGAAAIRKEMLKFRPGSDTAWPLLDSMAMASALLRPVATRDQRAEAERKRLDAEKRAATRTGATLGVSFVG